MNDEQMMADMMRDAEDAYYEDPVTWGDEDATETCDGCGGTDDPTAMWHGSHGGRTGVAYCWGCADHLGVR